MERRSICSFNCFSSTLWFLLSQQLVVSHCNVLSLLGAIGSCTLILPGSPHWPPPSQTLSQSIFMELPWHCTAVKEYPVFSTSHPELQQSSQGIVPWWLNFYFVSFYQFSLNYVVFIYLYCWAISLADFPWWTAGICTVPSLSFIIIFHTSYIVTETLL